VVSLTPGKIAPFTHWIGCWVGPSTGLDDVEKRKFLALPGLNSDPSAVQSEIRYAIFFSRFLVVADEYTGLHLKLLAAC
jgi:hypothetical protein